MKTEMSCIVCPMSCLIMVEQDDITKEIVSITGNTCKRGENYARNELIHPMRQLTSTVAIDKGIYNRLPVILSAEVPKEKLFDVMEQIRRVKAMAPVEIGQVLISDVCGLGVDVLASRSMPVKGESDGMGNQA